MLGFTLARTSYTVATFLLLSAHRLTSVRRYANSNEIEPRADPSRTQVRGILTGEPECGSPAHFREDAGGDAINEHLSKLTVSAS